MSLNNSSASPWEGPSGSQSVPPRKKLLKAPSLAELDSSDSDVSMTVLFVLLQWRMSNTQYLEHVQQKWINVLCLVHQEDFVVHKSISSSSVATSLMDDTSPESTVGKKSTKKICCIVVTCSHSSYMNGFAVLKFTCASSSFLLLNSASNVPAHILNTTARTPSDPPEETFHWEGDPD